MIEECKHEKYAVCSAEWRDLRRYLRVCCANPECNAMFWVRDPRD